LAFDNTVPKDVGWTTVVSNQYVHMALDDRNRVWTWGTGDYGRLGHANSDTVYSPRLVNVLAGKPVAQVAAGYNHALFLVEGKVYACGSASYYQLANNSSTSQSVPTLVNSISRPVNLIGAGGNHSFAQTEDGLYSWGQNQRGELGVGDRNTRTTPTRVNLPDASVRFVQITGGNYHSIALSTAGHVYTFGGVRLLPVLSARCCDLS
jgi:alpha-tubulin suppressor-like RCC1 family protein